MSLTRALVERINALRFGDLSEDGRAAICHLLVDFLGVTARGSRSEAAVAVRESLADLGEAGPHPFPLVGTRASASALQAAFTNAVAGHSIEYDDTHQAASSHPGVVVFPAAFAAAVMTGATQRDFLLAVAKGYEVMCRLGRAANPPGQYRRHFHPTGTTGHIGAAAVGASLLDLTAEQTVSALGIAATMAAGSMEFLTGGSWTKPLHPGQAARNGVHAAMLARRGFRGPEDGIGGPHGFLATHSDDPKPDLLLARWGEMPLEVRNTSIKAHACCRYSQGAIDALLEIRRRHALLPQQVVSITIGLVSTAIDIVSRPVDGKRRPSTVIEAQFSMPFGAALAVLEGKAGLAQHDSSRLLAPAILDLMDRTECVADPELDRRYPAQWPTWARVTTNDGRTLEARVDHPKGDPPNPLSPAELRAKFDELTAPVFSTARQAAIADTVAQIAEPEGLKTLIELLRGDLTD